MSKSTIFPDTSAPVTVAYSSNWWLDTLEGNAVLGVLCSTGALIIILLVIGLCCHWSKVKAKQKWWASPVRVWHTLLFIAWVHPHIIIWYQHWEQSAPVFACPVLPGGIIDVFHSLWGASLLCRVLRWVFSSGIPSDTQMPTIWDNEAARPIPLFAYSASKSNSPCSSSSSPTGCFYCQSDPIASADAASLECWYSDWQLLLGLLADFHSCWDPLYLIQADNGFNLLYPAFSSVPSLQPFLNPKLCS